jgi:hypothetical protein
MVGKHGTIWALKTQSIFLKSSFILTIPTWFGLPPKVLFGVKEESEVCTKLQMVVNRGIEF